MTIYRRTGGAWNTIAKVYRRAGGTWNTIAAVYRRANSVWHRVYSATLVPSIQTRVELTQSTNSNSKNKTFIQDGDKITFFPIFVSSEKKIVSGPIIFTPDLVNLLRNFI